MNPKRDDPADREQQPEPRSAIDPDFVQGQEDPGEMIPNESTAIGMGEPARFRATSPKSHTDPARLAEIRQRILDGAYNSLETVERVARRILSSGDL